jgi:hypothetical protein
MMIMAIKSTDIKEVTSYFCEKHQRKHNKGSKVFDTCFFEYASKASKAVPMLGSGNEHVQAVRKTLIEIATPSTPKALDNLPRGITVAVHGDGVDRPDAASASRQRRPTEKVGDGKAGVVANNESDLDGLLRIAHKHSKVANYRATRWEWPDGHGAFFSPSEMIQFAKRIAIAQGKKWHWWNEKKRKKDCKKAGIDPVNTEGQGDI